MHDIRLIRENPAQFDIGLSKRGLPPSSAEILDIDKRRRAAITESEGIQAKRKQLSQQIGMARRKGENTSVLMTQVESLDKSFKESEAQATKLDAELTRLLSGLPNLPADDVPYGADESDNREVARFGNHRNFAFPPSDHVALGEAIEGMDFAQAAKVSGSRFVYLKGHVARLERALAQFMLDLHTGENGYVEVSPPLLVRDSAMFGTAQLPKFALDQFPTFLIDQKKLRRAINSDFQRVVDRDKKLLEDALRADVDSKSVRRIRARALAFSRQEMRNVVERAVSEGRHLERLWLIPTAEVSLTNLVNDKVVEESVLPLRFTACTPSFRSEAGAAGRDTRGMIRQHQFSKVELVSITTPEQSEVEHERMTASAQKVLKILQLPFRTVLLSSGDMGFSARKTFDLEVWLPSQGRYREISSCSNCGDFQARRMNARYRPKEGKGTRFVHTLNGSGLAVGRTLIAILENYQNEDGSVTVPEALRSYMGGLQVIPGPAK